MRLWCFTVHCPMFPCSVLLSRLRVCRLLSRLSQGWPNKKGQKILINDAKLGQVITFNGFNYSLILDNRVDSKSHTLITYNLNYFWTACVTPPVTRDLSRGVRGQEAGGWRLVYSDGCRAQAATPCYDVKCEIV